MNDFIKFVENYQHKTDLTLVFLRDMSTDEYFYSVFISCKWDIETPCYYKDFKKIDSQKESKIIDKFKTALTGFNIKSKWVFEKPPILKTLATVLSYQLKEYPLQENVLIEIDKISVIDNHQKDMDKFFKMVTTQDNFFVFGNQKVTLKDDYSYSYETPVKTNGLFNYFTKQVCFDVSSVLNSFKMPENMVFNVDRDNQKAFTTQDKNGLLIYGMLLDNPNERPNYNKK